MEENMLTANYLHEVFCEIMECSMFDEDVFQIRSYDDIDFAKKMKKIGMEPDEEKALEMSAVLYPKGNKVVLYTNQTQLDLNPYVAMELIFAKLFDVYKSQMPAYISTYNSVKNFLRFKNVSNAFEIWTSFCTNFFAIKILKNLFDEDSPYSEEELIPHLETLLSEMKNNEDYSAEEKFNALLYVFSNFMAYEPEINSPVQSMHNLKKIKIRDMTPLVGEELGKLYNEFYQELFFTVKASCSLSNMLKINKKANKIIKTL